jgi:hypothetical protein
MLTKYLTKKKPYYMIEFLKIWIHLLLNHVVPHHVVRVIYFVKYFVSPALRSSTRNESMLGGTRNIDTNGNLINHMEFCIYDSVFL